MSRCFPFPPPGYEKKARPDDDADLLKKEKPKEKKHKKEKRDKEKREGKEKREKDRSDGKHREKKDKKEKHREKKKDKEKDKDKDKEKDKDRDKEKASTSEEKGVARQSESYNKEKLYQKEERGKEKRSISDEKKPAVQFQGQNGGKPIPHRLLAEETQDSKFVQELGRRIRDEEKGTTGNQSIERVTVTDRKKDEGMDRYAVKDPGMLVEGKEKNKDNRVDSRKMDGQGFREEARISGNAMVQNLSGIVQDKVEGMSRPFEKNMERRMEGKEKSKEREGDDKRGDKRKDKDREKKSHGKDKDREKEKKKEEKVKEKSEHKKTQQDKVKDSHKNDFVVSHNIKTSHLPNDCNQNAATEGNLRKRKELETNGFLHDNDVRPNKMPRITSHPLKENGRKLEPSQTPILPTSDRKGAASNLKVDNKERKVNGIIEAKPLSVSTTKPLIAITHVDQIAQASKKPPHPDSKYLSQVLTVPKIEEWSGFDDQDWLFSSKDPPSKKPETGPVGVNEELRVWDEALQLESADVCALPYVIPY